MKFKVSFLKENIQKMNPINGIKNFFSFQLVIEFFKIIIKMFIVSFFFSYYVIYRLNDLFFLIKTSYTKAFFLGMSFIYKCYLLIMILFIPVVIIDVYWNNFNYYRKMKMSVQELKEEIKEMEGNTIVKDKILREMRKNTEKKFFDI
ncbi:EscU/YscU/HrcU family type III secretion system export apparatus switch protein [Buchnera aphidicola (Mindarus keteleerifoliae)]